MAPDQGDVQSAGNDRNGGKEPSLVGKVDATEDNFHTLWDGIYTSEKFAAHVYQYRKGAVGDEPPIEQAVFGAFQGGKNNWDTVGRSQAW